MNIRDLEYLAAIAKFRHFGKAAEHCHVSQPSLSSQIKKLEEYLGITLFERTNKSVMTTPEGEAVLAHALAILRHAEEIREIGKQAGDPMSGRLKLGIIPTMGPYYLPRILPLLTLHFPKLEVELFEAQTKNLLEQMKRGELDVIFLALPLHEEALEEAAIAKEPFTLAVPLGHRLTAKKSVTLEDLSGEDLLLLEDGHCLRDQALEVCRMAAAHEQINARATSLETLRQMVANHMGLTLMPEMATSTVPDGLAYLPFRAPAPHRIVGLAWRKSTPRGPLFKAIQMLLMNDL